MSNNKLFVFTCIKCDLPITTDKHYIFKQKTCRNCTVEYRRTKYHTMKVDKKRNYLDKKKQEYYKYLNDNKDVCNICMKQFYKTDQEKHNKSNRINSF